MSDELLYAKLRRAMRNTLILGIIPSVVVGIASGWRNAAMLLTGMLISAASIWEWRRLARLISARLDHQRTPMGTPLVVFFFLIRLGIFAAAIYGSLKFIHGSSIALLCGLSLALFTISWEALEWLRE
ncbi:MAG: ATP synthase subunit I [Terracidiphilus sp.]